MKKKRLLALALAAAAVAGCFASAGCGKKKGSEEGTLDITFYNGGCGEEWLTNACERYKAIHPDFKYNLIPETDGSCNASTILTTGKNLPDVIMGNNLGFAEFVTSGKIESLEDVYSAKVTTSNGEKTVYEYLSPAARDKYYMQKRAGQTENLPWAMPWTILPCAMVYNENVLLSTVHVESGFKVSEKRLSGGKWIAPPETVEELLAYFADVNAGNETRTDKITPFGWPGTSPNYFFFMLYKWWAEDQGLSVSNYEGEDSWYDFWNYGNTATSVTEKQTLSLSVFNQSGQKKAIDTLRSLIIGEDGKYINSPEKVNSLSLQQLEQSFVQGKVAIALGSSFIEKEMQNFITDKTPSFKFMNVPSLDGYTGDNYCLVNVGEIMYIPAKATDKELAKDFLIFLSEENNLVEFAKDTGSLRAFDYDPLSLAKDYKWTEFNKSVMEIYKTSVQLVDYPKNVADKNLISYVYRYSGQTMFGAMQMADMLKNLSSMNGKELMAKVVEETKDSFDGYKSIYNMDLV